MQVSTLKPLFLLTALLIQGRTAVAQGSSPGAPAQRPSPDLTGTWRVTIVHTAVHPNHAQATFERRGSGFGVRLRGPLACSIAPGADRMAEATLEGHVQGNKVELRAIEVHRTNGDPCGGSLEVTAGNTFTGELSPDGHKISGKLARLGGIETWLFVR